jgi:hypothetical protein
MSLNKTQLQDALLQAFTTARQSDASPEVAAQQLSEQLTKAIDEYLRSADIHYGTGLIAPSSGGPVTGTFIGNLN